MAALDPSIREYNDGLGDRDRQIAHALAVEINAALPDADSKIWHAHPVWFLDGNPIVGYGKLKNCIRLMFWSGASFDESGLDPGTGKFKDASTRFTSVDQIDKRLLRRWLEQSRDVQWDYKNVVKRKGELVRLK